MKESTKQTQKQKPKKSVNSRKKLLKSQEKRLTLSSQSKVITKSEETGQRYGRGDMWSMTGIKFGD